MTNFSFHRQKSKAEPKFTKQARSSEKTRSDFLVKKLKQSRFITAIRSIARRPRTTDIGSGSGVLTGSSSSKSETQSSTSDAYNPVNTRDVDIFEPRPGEPQYLHFDSTYPGMETQLRAEITGDARLKFIGKAACERGAWNLHLPWCSCARHLDEDCWGCDESDYGIHHHDHNASELRDLRIIAHYFSECHTNATKALDWFLTGETDREGLKARVIPTLYEMAIMSYQWMMMLKDFSEPPASRLQASNLEDGSSNDDSFYPFTDTISYLDLDANDSRSDTGTSCTSRASISSISTATDGLYSGTTTTISNLNPNDRYQGPSISPLHTASDNELNVQTFTRTYLTSQHLSRKVQRLDEDSALLIRRRTKPNLGSRHAGLRSKFRFYKALLRVSIGRKVTRFQARLHVRLTRTQQAEWVEKIGSRIVETGNRRGIAFLEWQTWTVPTRREVID